jgi:GNAT superfamily N-acetyltransferase
MIDIKIAVAEDWQEIRRLAYAIWPETYGQLIPAEQLEYMLALIYNESALKDQMLNHGQQFILAVKDNIPVGFASFETNYKGTTHMMLYKIYLLPEIHGQGVGQLIMEYLSAEAKKKGNDTIRLKVFHKNQKAIEFYLKNGFSDIGIETTDPGNGYLIADNIMIKKI